MAVSIKTISRMVDRGQLQRIQGLRHHRIPNESVANLINGSLEYNPACVGSAVQEKRTCHISKLGVHSGGHRTPTQTGRELDDLLEQATVKRLKH